MVTLVGTQKDPVSLLTALVELDYDAIEAYRAAIERLDSDLDRQQLKEFMQDHERHVIDLSPYIEQLGGDVPKGPDIKQILTKGKVVIGGLMGDKAILLAMKTNEDDTNAAYERAVQHDLSADLILLLEQNLSDERRHRAWIEQRLEDLGEEVGTIEEVRQERGTIHSEARY